MNVRWLICVVLSVCAATLHASSLDKNLNANPIERCLTPSVELGVMKAFLRDWKSPVVVVTQTDAVGMGADEIDGFNLQLATRGQGTPKDLRENFRIKSKSTCTLAPFGDLRNVKFISATEHIKIFSTRNGWRSFHSRFGKDASLIEFSRVGFNSDKNLALFHVSSGIGWMGGSGSLYVYQRKGTAWVEKSSVLTWTT